MFLDYFNLIVFYSLRAFCAQPSSFLLHILVDSFSEIKFPNIILCTSLRTFYYLFITWYTQTQLILVDPYPFIILLSCWLQQQKLTYHVLLYPRHCWFYFVQLLEKLQSNLGRLLPSDCYFVFLRFYFWTLNTFIKVITEMTK